MSGHNTLDGFYILIRDGAPVFWEQANGKAGLVLADSHESARRFAAWLEFKKGSRASPYLVGSGLNVSAEEKAHRIGEGLDVVYVLQWSESGKPLFLCAPPEALVESEDE